MSGGSLQTLNTVPVHSLYVRDILDKETAKENEKEIQLVKSKQVTKSIIEEERLQVAYSGHQSLQLEEQILSYMESLESMLGQHIRSHLSKLQYMDSFPAYHVSNLCHFSTKIIMDIEKSEEKEMELKMLTEKFIVQQHQSVTEIRNQKQLIMSRCSTNEILSKVKDSVWTNTKNYPEILLKLSILLEQDNFLSIFLKDILGNLDKKRPVWSENTLNVFSLLINYGGPKTVTLIRKNFGGPHLSTIYIKSRQNIKVESILKEEAFSLAAKFYRNILKDKISLIDIIFTIAIDATPILPIIRARGNHLVGFATLNTVEVKNAEDIITAFKNRDMTTAQQTYVIVLTPLRSDIPYFILAAPPVIKGESHQTIKNLMVNSVSWGQRNGLNIYGLGADGDAKIRSYYQQRFLKKETAEKSSSCFTINRADFLYFLPRNIESSQFECPFPDPRHLIKKWRNQILNVRRFLVLGNDGVQLEHLMEIADCDSYKHKLGLWKTDIKVNDKQNVNAAVRLFQTHVQDCLEEYNEVKFRSTICYLKLGSFLYQTFFVKDIDWRMRVRHSWTVVQFLRLWRIWIDSSGYSTDKNFISDQTYNDVLIAGHSFILFSKLHFIYHREQPFEPWMWGSNACEEIFAKARCFVRTKNNFCHLEFLDICKRLQKVSELEMDPTLKTKDVSKGSHHLQQTSTSEFQKMLEEEMEKGDLLACQLAKLVGFQPNLVRNGIIKLLIKAMLTTKASKFPAIVNN